MQIGKAKFAQGIIVRLFRIWSASRAAGHDQLPAMLQLTSRLGLPDETALTCASLFELVESQLGRALVPECSCSQKYSTDETALVGVLATAPQVGSVHGTPAIPHGLPDAICWTVSMVRESLGLSQADSTTQPASAGKSCPFGQPQLQEGSAGGI